MMAIRVQQWLLAGLVVEVLKVERRDTHWLPPRPSCRMGRNLRHEPALVFPCFAMHPRGLGRRVLWASSAPEGPGASSCRESGTREMATGPLSVSLGRDAVLPPWSA